MFPRMYQIWRGCCGRASQGPRFRHLSDALRYVQQQNDGSSYAIRTPAGRWHHFDDKHVTMRPRRVSGISPILTAPVAAEDIESGAA